MKRREFITLLGSAVVGWPLAAKAQQPRAMPVIGFLHMGSPDGYRTSLAAFRQGLNEAGFVEGRNVAIEFRWAEGQYDRLQTLAADLVRRRVAVLFVNGPTGVRAARAATETIPIVFAMGEDPVIEGLVAGLNRPGANITGHTSFSNQLAGKRLGLMHEIIAKDGAFAFLVNPTNPNVEADTRDTQKAADALRRKLKVFAARSADFCGNG
jgi:putative ABC transport system substrate-binding protein